MSIIKREITNTPKTHKNNLLKTERIRGGGTVFAFSLPIVLFAPLLPRQLRLTVTHAGIYCVESSKSESEAMLPQV